MTQEQEKTRCAWVKNDPLYTHYHDTEWGVPLFDDRRLFEFLILEGAQAGLSFLTILKKRENYREAFQNFNPNILADFDSATCEKLLQNPGIIRHRLKIQSVVKNAQAYLRIEKEGGSFSEYLWQFVNGKPQKNAWKTPKEIPTETQQSKNLSLDLKKRGFQFVGSTMCYAFMQAVGMVNDHLTSCFCYTKLQQFSVNIKEQSMILKDK